MELRFNKPWPNAVSPIELRFIDESVFAGVTLRFDELWLNAASPLILRFEGDIDPPIPVDNTIGIECGIVWLKPTELQNEIAITEAANDVSFYTDLHWLDNHSNEIFVDAAWVYANSIGITKSISWRVYESVRSDTSVNWSLPIDHQIALSLNWVVPDEHQIQSSINWLDITAHQLHTAVAWINGQDQERPLIIQYRGIVVDDEKSIKWGFHEPRWVCSTKYRPPVGKVTLRFNEPLSTQPNPIVLRFTASPNYCYWDDGGGLIDANPPLPNIDFKIPIEPQIRRYYLMQPTITCVRVSDSLPIVITSVSISQSRGQWARSVSLEFSSRIDAQRAHNELLLITINGYEFYAIAEQPSSSKAFGIETHSSTGRSRAAELSSPYLLPISYTNTVLRSLGGIIGDLLQNTGWTAELSGIPDFSVPAGAFSVGNKSPIDAINEAASQLGCMILADDATRKLTIIPRWPTVPWEMATAVPDLTVHDAVITNYSESVSRNPLCDVVWLRGEQQGISAKVKRTGSAGNIPAADISAQLIVDNQAARIAGTNALADTGDKLNVTLSLPVMVDLPPATPGMLIGIREGAEVFKGTCDSWSIRASVSDRGDIDIEQSITVIRSIA
ncbi:hypothetical protein ACRN94_01575 [Shewanella baltica]|uniref:hypothetical protein n=1 Tax=Shewanella baltica TaxID=62322 RepID=UPI003D7A5B04